ncbi:MAG: hypothetical protein Q8Q09_01815 [Deltaproteobacteria bacterium]|nr:hypothetical protein [Deltaproteobacteria bacterium]
MAPCRDAEPRLPRAPHCARCRVSPPPCRASPARTPPNTPTQGVPDDHHRPHPLDRRLRRALTRLQICVAQFEYALNSAALEERVLAYRAPTNPRFLRTQGLSNAEVLQKLRTGPATTRAEKAAGLT